MSTPQLDLILTVIGALAIGFAWIILLLLLKIDELSRKIERQKSTPFSSFLKSFYGYASFLCGVIAVGAMFLGSKKRKTDTAS